MKNRGLANLECYSLLRTGRHGLTLGFTAADSPAFAEATADKQGCLAKSGSRQPQSKGA
jgi:hypothetical protein